MKIADMHCDTISKLWECKRAGAPQALARNSFHVDIQKMRQAGYALQNFAMFVDLGKGIDPFAYVCELIDLFYEEMEQNENDIHVIKCHDDFLENECQGKMSALLTIEEGGCCEGEIANLEILYARGARMMTLTWNYPNELGFPNISVENMPFNNADGLTRKGFEFVGRMEELGMIIDVSHLSDAGFWDVAHHTKKPFVASHSNARALCGHRRNLTDEMIRAVAERGGVIGLNFCGAFLDDAESNADAPCSSVKRIAEHARHMINAGGVECVGLGTDFDGIGGTLEIADCSQMEKLVREFERQHFTPSEIEHILCGNVLRVYREML